MTDQQRMEMIANALDAFVSAQTWTKSKRIVEAQLDLLLTDEAEFVLTLLLQQYAHDQNVVRLLQEHHELLQGCRAEGIEAAFAERIRPATTPDIPPALMARLGSVRSEAELEQLLREHPELLPVLMQMQNAVEENPQLRLVPLMQALIQCDSPHAVLTLVAQHSDLLSDEMDALLQQFIAHARAQGNAKGDGMAQHVEKRHATLRQLRQIMRETGMSAKAVVQAVRGVQEMPPDTLSQTALLQSMQGLVTSSNWLEARLYVEEHPELLSDEADRMLADMITEAQKQGEEGMVRHFQEHRTRLARARQEGLDAIAPAMPPEAQPFMGMLANLPDEVQNSLLALMANDANPQELEALLTQHPELKTALEQLIGSQASPSQSIPPAFAADFQRAIAACDRLHMDRSPQALNAAVQAWQTILVRPDLAQYPEFAVKIRVEFADTLLRRYWTFGQVADLEEAIRVYQQALEQTPQGSPNRPRHLNNLGTALKNRFNLRGQVGDLEEAIRVYQQALDQTPQGAPALLLSNLGNALMNRFNLRGQVADLEEAIKVHQQALEQTPQGSPDRPSLLNNLGTVLSDRFNLRGQVADLEKAIKVHQQALDETPQGSPDRPSRLNNLGRTLSDRFSLRGKVADLEEAIRVYQQALDEPPQGSPKPPSACF